MDDRIVDKHVMDDRSYVLQALFDLLEEDGIPYCVVGDPRGLPEHIASDVDLVVPHDAFAEMPRALAWFCRTFDLRLVQMIRHEQSALYFILAWSGETGELRTLAIDVCSDYRRAGRRLLGAEELLTQRERAVDESGTEQGYYVPAPYMQFIYYLLKKVDKLELNSAHGEYLTELWRSDSYRATREIARFWHAPADAELLERAAGHGEWAAVRAQLPRLRRAMRRVARLTVVDATGELGRRLGRLRAPTGLVVALLGPDGAGKSSVIERMMEDLAPVFRRVRSMHLRPRMRWWRRGREDLPVTEPHAQPQRGAGASTLKLCLFVLDYAAGYLLRIWPDRCRSTLVAFDRYLHDMLVDPRRYRYGGPPALARWAAHLVPQPDLWIVLDAPAEVLQGRKPEVAGEESERQRADYLRLARRLRSAEVIDATGAPHLVAAEAEAEILRYLEQRLQERHAQVRLRDNPRRSRVLLFFSRHRVPLLSAAVGIAFNCDIHCRLRAPILLPHPYGIVIHSKTRIGRRVTVMQQATLGGKDVGRDVAPLIEDDVYIGAGARVLGEVRVGRGATIGANAVVTRDVPPYCTVVGANRIVRGSVVDVARERGTAGSETLSGSRRSA